MDPMKPLIVAFCVFAFVSLSAQTPAWQPSPGHTQIPIWPGAAPDPQPVAGPEVAKTTGKDVLVAGRPAVGVSNVTRPTMTVYSPKGKNTGAAVVVFPGGGYQILAIDLEGTEVCDWLTSKGITCVLLKYRVTGCRAVSEIGAISAVADGAGRCAENGGAGALSRRGVAYRSAQDRSARVFGRRAFGRRRSARILRSVCIRLWMRPTRKAAARILRWLFIRGICGFTMKNFELNPNSLSPARRRLRFCCRRRMTTWTM